MKMKLSIINESHGSLTMIIMANRGSLGGFIVRLFPPADCLNRIIYRPIICEIY